MNIENDDFNLRLTDVENLWFIIEVKDFYHGYPHKHEMFFLSYDDLLTPSLYEKRCTPSNMPAKGRNKLQKNAFYSVTFAHPISKVFCMIFRQISRRGNLISKNRKFSANH